MQHFELQKHTDSRVIFSGKYISFSKCLEDAVDKKTDLSYIDLRNKNLSNANIDGAYMPNAYLIGTNLTGANLSEANLKASTLFNCSLYNTCLSYAELSNSDFRGANFGATLIDGANMQSCIFSTLSCFDLDFLFTRSMDGCSFLSDDGALHRMSQHPIVLKGYMNTHIIIFDNSIKIGVRNFPKTILPALMKIIGAHALSPTNNNNQLLMEGRKETKNLA